MANFGEQQSDCEFDLLREAVGGVLEWHGSHYALVSLISDSCCIAWPAVLCTRVWPSGTSLFVRSAAEYGAGGVLCIAEGKRSLDES